MLYLYVRSMCDVFSPHDIHIECTYYEYCDYLANLNCVQECKREEIKLSHCSNYLYSKVLFFPLICRICLQLTKLTKRTN